MPPLDVSWNPCEEFKYQNCFINLNKLLKNLKGHYYNHFQYNSLTYIQINIASAIIKNNIFFDDKILLKDIVILFLGRFKELLIK